MQMRMFVMLSAIGLISICRTAAQEPNQPKKPLTFATAHFNGSGYEVTTFRIVTEGREMTYSVEVPYTEQLENGSTVTKTRTETRSRVVPVSVPVAQTRTWPVDGIELSTISGRVAEATRARQFLSTPRTVVLEPRGQTIDPYYLSILNPSGLVVFYDPFSEMPPAPREDSSPAADVDDLFGDPVEPAEKTALDDLFG